MRQKQIDESKERITNGFFDVLSDVAFEDITMSAIADRAMVSRMTLYRHFKNKEEIVKDYLNTVHEDVYEMCRKQKVISLKDLLYVRFERIARDERIPNMYEQENLEPLLNRFILKNKRHFKPYMPKLKDPYRRAFIESGVDAVTKRWIASGMKESPKEITDRLWSIMKGVMTEEKEQVEGP